MIDAIAVILTLALAGGSLLMLIAWLVNIDRKRREMSEEEYQKQGRHPRLIGAGLTPIDQFLRPDMERAAEYRIDADQGRLPGGAHNGEKLPEPEPEK
jgi:hypothetical protein